MWNFYASAVITGFFYTHFSDIIPDIFGNIEFKMKFRGFA